jgi:hypothetical protein
MQNQFDRIGQLHALDFMERSYNTTKTIDGDPIVPMMSFRLNQYRLTGMNFKFIVKIFNNKIIKFKIFNLIHDDYIQDVIFPAESREWSLLLLITPIIVSNKLPYFICEKKYESFSYSISSAGCSQANDCIITLPAVNDGYKKYFVDIQLISALINNTTR